MVSDRLSWQCPAASASVSSQVAVTNAGSRSVHEWTDQASFDRYLASDAFQRSGEILRPILLAAPTSRRFLVELIETVR